MAKEKMICPFSGELCKECPLYRGRHYYLCFSRDYRGCLGVARKAGMQGPSPNPGAIWNGTFDLSAITRAKPVDPFAMDPEANPRKEG